MRLRAPCSIAALLTAACGGQVVFVEGDGGGGSGGAPGTTSSKSSSVVVSSSQTATSSVSSTSSVMPTGDNLVEIPLGVNLPSGTVTAPADASTLGLTLVLEAPNPFADVSITRQGAPSGATVIGSVVPQNGFTYEFFGTIAQATPQVSHPETFPVAPGTWSWDYQVTGTANASVWQRRTVDGGFHGGVLDVNVFIPDGFVSQDQVLDVLGNAYSGWAGIQLGEVRFFDVGPQFLTVDENNVFDYTAATSVAPTIPALNIMMTASIEGQFAGAGGFSLGAPGAPVAPGSTMSGVVWMFFGDDFFDPIILAHEGGHFGGLFHTSEFDPGLGDALDDTPLCQDVINQMESCPDIQNIMFPTGGFGAEFSSLQSRVLQGSTIYRGSFAPGEPPMAPIAVAQNDGGGSADQSAIQGIHRAQPSRTPRSPKAGSWQSRVSAGAAATLAGIGCPHGSSLDYFDTLAAAGGTDLSALLDIGTDPGAPAYVRRRAIGMAARLAPSDAAVRDVLDAIASDENEPSTLRGGALRSLAGIDRGRARATGAAIDTSFDPILELAAAAIER